MNNMPAFVQIASMSFKCIFFFKFMITNKIYTEMPLQGSLPLYECPHSVTLALLISRVCMYIIYIYIYTNTIYIDLHFTYRKFIHTPDNAHLFYIIVFHAYLYFSALTKIKIFLSLSSTNSLQPVDAYMCQKSNLEFVKIIACRLIGAEPFFKVIHKEYSRFLNQFFLTPCLYHQLSIIIHTSYINI